ncbi:hypothetical protein NC653_039276 [Populus alba x Populus x berolinensis]|uniref:Uncharacterized protein n=1 Tax=Populus alba x Populus x berolinensis TaxID=444605 RepID=A0AAD6LB33_9ROSI|nr:hypothetical protein NC653_039276 [Populus alba x Populus x berolinensis]
MLGSDNCRSSKTSIPSRHPGRLGWRKRLVRHDSSPGSGKFQIDSSGFKTMIEGHPSKHGSHPFPWVGHTLGWELGHPGCGCCHLRLYAVYWALGLLEMIHILTEKIHDILKEMEKRMKGRALKMEES